MLYLIIILGNVLIKNIISATADSYFLLEVFGFQTIRFDASAFYMAVTRAETRQCGAPPKSSFGAPKHFFLNGDAKERALKGRCQARGVWGHALPENFAEFHLILEAFCAF